MTRCASRTTPDRVIKAIRNARAKMRGMATPHRLGVILAAARAMTKPALAANITKETLTIDRTPRTYFIFVPDSVGLNQRPSSSRCTVPAATDDRSSSRFAAAVIETTFNLP